MVRLFTPGWVVVDAVSQAWELLQCMVVQILLLDAWGQYWPPCCHPCPRGAFFPTKQQQQHKTQNTPQLKYHHHHHYKYPATPSETNPHQNNCNHLLPNTQNSHKHTPEKPQVKLPLGRHEKPPTWPPQKKNPRTQLTLHSKLPSKLHLLKLTHSSKPTWTSFSSRAKLT